jgi:dynein heavy chain 1
MDNVHSKVQRSIKLIDGLGSESARWEADAQTFKEQTKTVMGDTLVCAAFLAYIGYFNQHFRARLVRGRRTCPAGRRRWRADTVPSRAQVEQWQERLHEFQVPCKDALSVVEYLSHPSERLQWLVRA